MGRLGASRALVQGPAPHQGWFGDQHAWVNEATGIMQSALKALRMAALQMADPLSLCWTWKTQVLNFSDPNAPQILTRECGADGSCLYLCVADRLEERGCYVTASSLRDRTIAYIRTNLDEWARPGLTFREIIETEFPNVDLGCDVMGETWC